MAELPEGYIKREQGFDFYMKWTVKGSYRIRKTAHKLEDVPPHGKLLRPLKRSNQPRIFRLIKMLMDQGINFHIGQSSDWYFITWI